MNTSYWETEKVIICTEKKKYAKEKWEEYKDTRSREMLQLEIELPPISFEEYEKYFEDCKELNKQSTSINLYIENKKNEFVGWININWIDKKNGTFSLGMGIFKDFQNKGYGTDAGRLVLNYCFNELRLNKCNNDCIDYNEASIQFHKRFGFTEEGRRRESVYIHGEYRSMILWGLLKEEFNKKK